MSRFIIQGQTKLQGEIEVAGSKNAALPLISAALLTDETVTITNVPDIIDIDILLEIISQLGVRVARDRDQIEINAKNLKPKIIDPNYFKKLRASILLLGSLLGRFGHARLNYPGGCVIGQRPIDIHIEAVKKLGGTVKEKQEYFQAELEAVKGGLIYSREASVTATENILMIAASRPSRVVIERAACEPHVETLAQMLVKMGAKITGVGSNRLEIIGRKNLSGTEIKVNPDEIEAGTFIALAAASRSKIKISKIDPDHLRPILNQIELMDIDYRLSENSIEIIPSDNFKAANVSTEPWPAFPTDLQPPFTVLATQATGNTIVHEKMYDSRLYFTDKLISMGAKIIPCDPHRVVVSGPTELTGGLITSPDIRAGIALVIAGIIAGGQSVIDNIDLVDRGYSNIEERLNKIGAKIKREE